MLVFVALAIPRLQPLTYSWPESTPLLPGMRVTVPLGRRTVVGVVVGEAAESKGRVLKNVINTLDEKPALTKELLKLGRWMAEYYQCTWGEALAAMLPVNVPVKKMERFSMAALAPEKQLSRGIAQRLVERLQAGPCLRAELLEGFSTQAARVLQSLIKQGWVQSEFISVPAKPEPVYSRQPRTRSTPLQLNDHQAKALSAIQSALQRQEYAGFLLHGVTGSGKTEVYLQAIAQTLEQKRGAIFLVPEISLTPQTRARIADRFGAHVEVLHSGITTKERSGAWRRIRAGTSQVVLGARSAIFAPVHDLGLIVVDEEYESSYKQEDSPRYHARDIAAVRAKAGQAVLVLGSATPAVETYYNAQFGKYQLLEMPERVDAKQLPKVRIVDMSREINPQPGLPIFSQVLLEEIEKRLDAKEQSILFLNRRGYAPLVMCPECRHILTCPDCSISLVYHQSSDRLLCHSCGKSQSPRPACPKCGTACIRLAGAGTQRVEAELQKYFPRAGILRLDQDTVRKRGVLEKIMDQFGKRQGDILVGTQMVAKGIDFPGVTLVGIISTDTALHFPDFRAEERTFQLLVQVAGRAGRGGKPGLVLAQTLNSGHPIIALAQKQNYLDFYNREIEQRRDLLYPPFARMANIILQGKNSTAVRNFAKRVVATMRKSAGKRDIILGPAPSPRERIAQESRFQILVKSINYAARSRVLSSVAQIKVPFGIRFIVDVDPQNML
ncbi:primosomal protein N' [bacterium]|nr:primosomal protein N' [bacterium]